MPFKKGEKAPGSKQFKKGETGNANGRPKKLPAIDKLLADVLGGQDEENNEAKEILKAMLLEAKSGNTKAAELLLDRAYGKAKLNIDHSSSDGTMSPTPITFTKGSNG